MTATASTIFLKKMTLKAMGCNARIARDSKYALGAKNEDGTPSPFAGVIVPLTRIAGRVTGIKTGERRDSDEIYTALKGKFEAVVLQTGDGIKTGQVYESGICFLPGGMQDVIEGALQGLGDDAYVEFAFEISTMHDPTTEIGYKYVGKNLLKPAVTDNMARLRALIGTGPEVQEPAKLEAPATLPAGAAQEPAKPATPPATQEKPKPAKK